MTIKKDKHCYYQYPKQNLFFTSEGFREVFFHRCKRCNELFMGYHARSNIECGIGFSTIYKIKTNLYCINCSAKQSLNTLLNSYPFYDKNEKTEASKRFQMLGTIEAEEGAKKRCVIRKKKKFEEKDLELYDYFWRKGFIDLSHSVDRDMFMEILKHIFVKENIGFHYIRFWRKSNGRVHPFLKLSRICRIYEEKRLCCRESRQHRIM